jgi:hypothetical protein
MAEASDPASSGSDMGHNVKKDSFHTENVEPECNVGMSPEPVGEGDHGAQMPRQTHVNIHFSFNPFSTVLRRLKRFMPCTM